MKKFDQISAIVDGLAPNGRVDELIKAWFEYESLLFPHLREEEEIALPLARAYFTPKEWMPVVQKIMNKSTKEENGSFVYFMGKNEFRRVFMKQEGIPSFVWHLYFRRCHSYYKSKMISHIHALKSGTPPPKSGKRKHLSKRTRPQPSS